MIAVSTDAGYVALFTVLILVPLVAIVAAVADHVIVRRRQNPVHRPGPTGGFPIVPVSDLPGEPRPVQPLSSEPSLHEAAVPDRPRRHPAPQEPR